MECPQCNEPVQPDWVFCQSCGTPLSNGQGAAAGQARAASASEPTAGRVDPVPADLGPVTTTLPATTDEEEAAVPATVWPAGVQEATRPPEEPARVTVRPLSAPLYLPNSPIRLGQDERILRQYAAVKVRRRKSGEGILYVTDSRIVFYARAQGRGTQRPSSLMQQTKISEVSGVAAYIFRRFALGYFIAAAFFGVLGLVALLSYPPIAILFLLICAGCILAIIGGAPHRGGTGVQISSSAESSQVINFGRWVGGHGLIGAFTHTFTGPITSIFGVYTVWDVREGMPSENSDQIISELGALILDLQTRGDLVFEHYGAGIAPAHEPQLPYGQV